jgi:hypothetical protein
LHNNEDYIHSQRHEKWPVKARFHSSAAQLHKHAINNPRRPNIIYRLQLMTAAFIVDVPKGYFVSKKTTFSLSATVVMYRKAEIN